MLTAVSAFAVSSPPQWPSVMTAWGTVAVAIAAVFVAWFAEWRATILVSQARKDAAQAVTEERVYSAQVLSDERAAADGRLQRQLDASAARLQQQLEASATQLQEEQ